MTRKRRVKFNTVGAATNVGAGKQLGGPDGGIPLTTQPRNRRERRALASWRRKQTEEGDRA